MIAMRVLPLSTHKAALKKKWTKKLVKRMKASFKILWKIRKMIMTPKAEVTAVKKKIVKKINAKIAKMIQSFKSNSSPSST